MAKVVFKIHMSVDGFVGAPDGDIGGLMVHRDEEARDWQLELVRGAGVHVMGRVLYDHMAGFWPSSTDPFAAPMNEIPKVVFSATLSDPGWGPVRVDSGPLGAGIARLRRENEKPVLVHGGAALARSLSAAGLIDEYHLLVHPVALGAGLPIFAERTGLDLLECRRFPSGVVLLSYRREGDV
ncbi:MAG: dihydrofolate reductase family protein [Solirubrobacterales bacterium]